MSHYSPDEIAAICFIDIAVIVIVARLMGMLFQRLRQPAVVGEILAGIALGPSLLGALPGDPSSFIFPTDVRPFLRVLAQLGLIIFMFIVGLELDVTLIRGKERAAATISLASVVLPFAMGVGLAVWLHQTHGVVAGKKVDLLPFALFIGASMSVTAFPVLARILTERGMYRTQIGALTLACAAVDDVLAWSILAVVLAVVASASALDLPRILLESVGFVALMFLVVKPQLRRLVDRFEAAGRLTPNILAVVLVGFLTGAFITDRIGIHSIFGAFVFGVVMPRERSALLFQEILEKLEQVSVLLLLPVFFISTGFNVNVRGIDGKGFVELLAVLAVACSGKFVGAAGAARALGIRARKAAAIGVLMNTRGLTELVILNVGLSVGVLDKRLFTILVLMAIFTTVITEPALRLVYPDKMLARDVAEAERAALGVIDAYRVIGVVGPEAQEELVDTGAALLGGEDPSELLLTRFDPPSRKVEVGSGLTSELASVAAGFGALQELVRRARALGATAAVRSQFSERPAQDLLALAAAVEADVVLLSVGPGLADDAVTQALLDEVASSVDCAVIVRVTPSLPPGDLLQRLGAPAAPTQLVVEPGPGDDGLAALEHGVRVARSTGVPLTVVTDGERRTRRVEEAAQRLSSAGVQVQLLRVGPEAGPAVLRVQGLAGRAPSQVAAGHTSSKGPVLLVRACADDKGERLFALIDELTAGLATPRQ